MRENDNPFDYIYLKDHLARPIGIIPEMIATIIPTKNPMQCLLWFEGEEFPRLFNHSLYEVVAELDTFYNAN
jgi:hypothetical protein